MTDISLVLTDTLIYIFHTRDIVEVTGFPGGQLWVKTTKK